MDIYFVEIKTVGCFIKEAKNYQGCHYVCSTPRVHWLPIIVPEFKWDVPDVPEENA